MMRLASSSSPINNWLIAALVCAASTTIAALLTLLQDQANWLEELTASNTIGFSIFGCVLALNAIGMRRFGIAPILLIATPVGMVLGGKLATLFGITGADIIGTFVAHPSYEWKHLGINLLLSASGSAFIVASATAVSYRLELEAEKRRLAEISRSQAVAELALLQAQIEPHFLFNTLAHVQSAIEQDPATGKQILENLIRYLRGTLRRTRNAQSTLAEEQELIESLLVIASIRLGARMSYTFNIPESLKAAVLPPLLLQPLVENAIKHGIEPAIEGGEIRVEGERVGDLLVLRVVDTGVGMSTAGPEGVGLANVRARLHNLYGEAGRLTLQSQPPRGVLAELRLPFKTN
jgi:signal transduction histidine kinase